MPEPEANDAALTVDELARRVDLPVRTIREYQTLRLLPAPARRGRVGVYGADHVERLALIARLQRRGYSLAGIRDLLEAWDGGADLPSLLGLDVGPGALDETPLRLTRAQLVNRLPGLTATTLRRLPRVGLAQPEGQRHYVVRSPALLALAADLVDAGIRLGDVLDLIGMLRDELGALAESVADEIVERIWTPLAEADEAGGVEPLLRRGRLLLLQGVVSTLADQLGAALFDRAAHVTNGDAFRRAIEGVRIGAITDAAGTIEHRIGT